MTRALFASMMFATLVASAAGVETNRKPEDLKMTLAWIVDAGEPAQYVFVINGVVAYRTVDGLKKYLKELPQGSTLTWAPGCCRMGNEPLLSKPKEMKQFEVFCKACGIKLVLVPSG